MMLIGWDLDGTTGSIDEVQLTLIDNVSDDETRHRLQNMYFRTRVPLLNPHSMMSPQDTAVVITGRPLWAREVTERWVERYLGIPVHFAEDKLPPLEGPRKFRLRPRKEIAQGKAAQIKRLGVAVYVDDEPEVVEELRRLVDIPVILYNARFK